MRCENGENVSNGLMKQERLIRYDEGMLGYDEVCQRVERKKRKPLNLLKIYSIHVEA